MVLARNAYRFGLLLVGYGIASGVNDLGGYGAEGVAFLGLAIGTVGLFGETLVHLGHGPQDTDRGGPDTEESAGGRDDETDGRDEPADDEADGTEEPGTRTGSSSPGRYW